MPSPSSAGVADASRAFILDTPPALWTPHRPARPDKAEGGRRFQLKADYVAAGDQPEAVKELVAGVMAREHEQVLLGVTEIGQG